MPHVDVLLLTGPAGVGKSTTSWELCAQLEAAGVGHAAIDTDELDRVVPAPVAPAAQAALLRRQLAAMWSSFADLGHHRLVLAGVMVSVHENLRWITGAVPGAHVTVVRLLASEETLRRRLDVREIGSGKEEQVARTMSQLRVMRAQAPTGAIVIDTDDRAVGEVAAEILERTGWLAP